MGWFIYDQVSQIDWKKATDFSSYSPEINTNLMSEYGVDLDKIGDAISRPMTEEDADRFLESHEWFYAQPESKHATDILDGVAEGEPSMEDVLVIWERKQELMELMGRFNDYIADNGGYLKQTDSAVRAIGTAAAAEAISVGVGGDPASDKVAKVGAEVATKAHSEAKSADPQDIAKLLEGKEIAGFKISKGIATKAKPGVVALTRMPKESFVAWGKLPQSKRQRLIDAYQKQRKFVIATQLNPVLNTAQLISTMQGLQ